MDFHVPEPTKTVKYSLLLIKPEVATLCLDYSADNPLTWPLVEVATPGLMSHVPGWVVYPTRVMELVSTSRYLLPRQTVCAEYESKTMNARFLKYPLNFDKNGVQRARIGMTKTDLEVWTAFMKVRNSWRAAHSAIAGKWKRIDGKTKRAVVFGKKLRDLTLPQAPPTTQKQPLTPMPRTRPSSLSTPPRTPILLNQPLKPTTPYQKPTSNSSWPNSPNKTPLPHQRLRYATSSVNSVKNWTKRTSRSTW